MSYIGNPTELCEKLRMRTDKPHFYIKRMLVMGEPRYSLDSLLLCSLHTETSRTLARHWLLSVNPIFYKTPGEAARAWYNHKR